MKKIFLLAVIAISFTFTANAQKLGFGVEVGGNLSNIYSETPTVKKSSDYLLGFQAGAFVDYSITDNLFIKAHFLFFTKGSYEKNEVTALGVTTKETWKSSPMYINIPIVFGVGFEIGDIKPYANAGVYLAYGVGGKQKYDNKVGSLENSYTTDFFIDNIENTLANYFHSHDAFDFGARVGIGLEFTNKYLVEINYDLGLIDIAPKDNILKKNNALSLTFGYRF